MNEEEAPIERPFSITFTELSGERDREAVLRSTESKLVLLVESLWNTYRMNRAARHLCGTRKIEWTEAMRV